MSSRQEEKERRRREREEREAQAAAASSRSRRLQIAGGAVVAIAVIVVAVVLITSGGGDGGGDDASTTARTEVTLPPRQIENLQEAADAAGCTYRELDNEGAEHVGDDVEVEYESNPPTSGNHHQVPAQDGIYAPGNSPAPEDYVHTLEHGRIIFQYQPGASDRTIATLEAIFNEEINGTPGYHAVVMENNTGMKANVAATAWTQMLTCPELNDEAIDAMRAFRERFTDQGPEFVP